MNAGFFTDPLSYPDATDSRRDESRGRTSRPVLRGMLAVGRRLINGRPDDALPDHILDDIGLSRSDLAALTL